MLKRLPTNKHKEWFSIGSGGLTGKGFNVVDLSVPVRESDMIFTVIAEDLVLLVVLLSWDCIFC